MSRSVLAADRIRRRLDDILDAIGQIDALLGSLAPEDLRNDRVKQAAYERFLEIVSEASRHVPDSMTATRPDVPWQRIRDLGNQIRHAYDKVDGELLWRIFAYGELATLREAVAGFTATLDAEAT